MLSARPAGRCRYFVSTDILSHTHRHTHTHTLTLSHTLSHTHEYNKVRYIVYNAHIGNRAHVTSMGGLYDATAPCVQRQAQHQHVHRLVSLTSCVQFLHTAHARGIHPKQTNAHTLGIEHRSPAWKMLYDATTPCVLSILFRHRELSAPPLTHSNHEH